MSTSPNPNGYIPVVFTYAGTTLSLKQFTDRFYVTLPGGAGVQLGSTQYYGYAPATANTLTLGTSYGLSSLSSPLSGLLPTNGVANTNLATAFANWAQTQAANTGQTSYPNLYLSHFTGGRIYLSNGNLKLGPTGEPTPAAPTDSAYALVYDLFEPYVGAQVNTTNVPGNVGDITDIDWFSFPITLKCWTFDFSNASATQLVCSSANEEQGGSGSSICDALQIVGSATAPTNQYPNAKLPTAGGSAAALRLAGPTMAAAALSYYTDPAANPFPYHYFDDYLIYLKTAQGGDKSLFTLKGSFAGIGSNPVHANHQPQAFSFKVDFSNITTASYSYPSGSVTQITPGSAIVLTGHSDKFGTEKTPFTITLPWAKGGALHTLRSSPTISADNNALTQGWLTLPTSTPTAPSGTYPSGGATVTVSARDSGGATLTPQSGTTILQLIYSVNTEPLSGNFDNLYANGVGTVISITGTSGLTLLPKALCTVGCDQLSTTVLTLQADEEGNIASISINDIGAGPGIKQGDTWTFPANTTGLGNNNPIVVTLLQNPPLRDVLILNSATYETPPTALKVAFSTSSFNLGVTATGCYTSGWLPSTQWTTLCQPAGTYGANAGYTVAGIIGSEKSYNGDVPTLQNDLFGWVAADLLAALNTGLPGSPIPYPPTGKTIGESSDQWFTPNDNPYTQGLWGANAWKGQKTPAGGAITNFWNTWAYNLATVQGGTDAYGFAFSDRFGKGILLGFSPPPPNPAAEYPVLLEVIVGDSPFITS